MSEPCCPGYGVVGKCCVATTLASKADSSFMGRFFEEHLSEMAKGLLCEIAGGSWSETSLPPVIAALRHAYLQGTLDGRVAERDRTRRTE